MTDFAQTPDETLIPEAGTDKIRNKSADEFLSKLEAHRRHAKDCLIFTQARQQRSVNKNRLIKEFEVGDLVLINPHSMRLLGDEETGIGKKLMMKYEGPFEIQDKLGPITYRLRTSSNYNFHPVINIEHLEPYKESPAELGNRVQRGARRDAKHEAKEEFEISEILDDRVKGKNRKEYLVRYSGYGSDEDRWLLAKHINAPELMRSYKSKKLL
jgi:hypothetical protein